MLKFKMEFRQYGDNVWKDGGIREMSAEGVKRDYGFLPAIGETLKDFCEHTFEETNYKRIEA